MWDAYDVLIGGYEFTHGSVIDLRRNDDGMPLLDNPSQKYNNTKSLPLHECGVGPFVFLELTPRPPQVPGVYAVVMDGTRIMYVGQAEKSVWGRWRSGAARISPRNCFKGGQSTNCYLNIVIHKSIVANRALDLFVLATSEYDEIEDDLIDQLQPPWNRQGIRKRI
jgi:hypothetical protein